MSQDVIGFDAVARALMASLADAVVACDREGVIRFWNPGAERMFGFSTDEAVGRTLDLIIPERQRARHWEGYRRVMQTGKSRYADGETLSVPAMRKDESRISVEFTITPMIDTEGRVAGLVAIMRDVAARFEELKALRRQLRDRA